MRRRIAAACAGMLLAHGALAAPEGELTLGAGFHYSSGDYGTSSTTRIASVAATASYETGPWLYKATVPYLRVTGDAPVIPGVGRVGGASARRTSEAGLGDIVLSATYGAFYDRSSTLGLDLTGKLKLATADENRGLGTGEHDVIFLAELYQSFERWTGFGGVGYHMLGSAPGVALDDVWSASLGAAYRIDERDSAGLSLEGRERVAPGAARQRELMAFFTRRLERLWKAQAYALIGLADGSPDWGVGLSLARPF